MKELLLAPDLYPKVVDGSKLVTIRKGYRDFEPGDTIKLVHVDHPSLATTRVVVFVLKCVAERIPHEYWQQDGFRSLTHMVNEMSKFYPDFNVQTPTTVIGWAPPRLPKEPEEEEPLLASKPSGIKKRRTRDLRNSRGSM